MTAPDPLPWLDQLDALRAAATPGPWGMDLDRTGGYDLTDEDGQFIADRLGALDEDNARLIVAGINSLPELTRLAREREALRTAVFALADELDHEGKQALILRSFEATVVGNERRANAARLRAVVATAIGGEL